MSFITTKYLFLKKRLILIIIKLYINQKTLNIIFFQKIYNLIINI